MKIKILTVFGTRPEIIKLAPLMKLLDKNFSHKMVYTNQHYSPKLHVEIKNDLGLRKSDYILPAVKSGLHGHFAASMDRLDLILEKEQPDYLLVQGDTNSSLLGALVGARRGIPIVHVEAGCRSGNIRAPEEQNRRMIDSISSIFFAADMASFRHLQREGHKKNIFMVGNTGLDAIRDALPRLNKAKIENAYALLTIHRMENTLSKKALWEKMEVARFVSQYIPVIFPAHPRTKLCLKRFKIKLPKEIRVVEPLSYLSFLQAMVHSKLILSDSGGIQEEAALLNRPCLVLRGETEWTRLIQAKKNFLVPSLGETEKKLIQKLLLSKAFYRNTQKRIAPGIETGASKKIIQRMKALKS